MLANLGYDLRKSVHFGTITQTLGTVINVFVPPVEGLFARVLEYVYTAAGTAHTLTLMRPIGQAKAAAAALAGQAVLVLDSQPATNSGLATNDVAANDWMAWENTDGTYSFDKVASVSGLSVTMTSNLPKAVAQGKRVWMFGLTTDLNTDGYAHPAAPLTASTTTAVVNTGVGEAGVASTLRGGEPMLLQSDNATAAGTVRRVSVGYTAR